MATTTTITTLSEAIRLIELLKQQVATQEAIIRELKAQLNKDSSNSSKPPSSDGLNKKNKPPVASQLKGKKKPRGGQQGHRGGHLKMVEKPDYTVRIEAKNCDNCGKTLAHCQEKHRIKRQVFDVEVARKVTEYQGVVRTCNFCQHATVPTFPRVVEASAQYGDQTKALALYCQQQFVPLKRLSILLKDLFGYEVSQPTLQNWEQSFASNLTTFNDQVLSHLSSEATHVKHIDETGLRVGGKTHWCHTLSSPEATYYHHSGKRKSLLEELQGIVIHDHYAPYWQLKKVKSHGVCLAHLLRELKGLMENDPSATWSKSMHRLLLSVCKKSKSRVSSTCFSAITRRYMSYLSRGSKYYSSLPPPPQSKDTRGRKKRHPGENLLLRLEAYQSSVLLCLKEEEVPATNNLAERDLRLIKVKQKVSGCFRSQEGAVSFLKIRSYLSTIRKRGENILSAILLGIKGEASFVPAS